MGFHFTKADVEILEQKTVYQGYFRLEQLRLRYRLFNGGWSKAVNREVFERGEAVGVLLFDPERNQLVLIEQFRAGIMLKTENPWIIEIVAGVIDDDEGQMVQKELAEQKTATRETQEETGLTVHNLFFISRHWVSPGGSTERISLFCGQIDSSQAQGVHGLANEGEDIRLHVLDVKKAYKLVNEGKFDNATTIIALLWLQQNEKMVRAVWSK
ncbi:MAG: NUDIX domain-containing protein [Rickettsiella sp.]|nr:NUDIX domain-containing protein [Rickettsiella sp.]